MPSVTEEKPVRLKNHHHYTKASGDCKILEAEPLELVQYRDLDSRAEAMQNEGFVTFPEVLNREEVQKLRTMMDEFGDQPDSAYYQRGHYGKEGEAAMAEGTYNKHLGKPFATDPRFLEYLDKPEILEVAEAIHGPNVRVIGGSIWVTGPGRYPMGLHVDYQPFGLPEDIAMDPRVNIPVFISTAHFYLNDMYDDLGPTVVVPGSHRSGRAPKDEIAWRGRKAQSFTCNAGDVMLFRSDLWHGALPNVANEKRYMLQVHYGNVYIDFSYASPFKKQGIAPEVVDAATPTQRYLLGERKPGHAQGSYIKEPIRLARRGRDAQK